MKVLPSTWVIGSVGLALTAAGAIPLLTPGVAGGDWFVACFIAVMTGVPVLLGAVAREAILRAPAGKYRRAITTGVVGGLGIGGGGGASGDGGAGGDGGGGGD
jgi:hypothetical protein